MKIITNRKLFKVFACSSLSLFFFVNIQATVWPVGAGRTYAKPSAVMLLVNDGDTVNIDAGTYTADVAKWTKDDLVFRGVGGLAHLKADLTSSGRKAIWVMEGNNAIIQFVEFSGCHDTMAIDKNWAGIREEGFGLTISNCYFHDNDNGILAGAKAGSKITIEYSEFSNNGFPDGYSHNLYIGEIDTLIFRYNYSHHTKQGHELKSRAHVNYILYNRLTNEANGTASRNVDLPQGGLAIVMGNIIQQSTTTSNSNLIGYKLEATSNPGPHNLYLINNTIVSDRNTAIFVSLGTAVDLYKGYNNIFVGPGSLLSGTSTSIDTSNNVYLASIVSAGFKNSSVYDYHLLISSPAIDKGKNAGLASNSFPLSPSFEYSHPINFNNRITSGTLDAGAYEYQNVNPALPTISIDASAITVAENIGQVSVPITISNVQGSQVTVNFTLSGTATNITDYTVVPSTSVVFSSTATNGSVQNLVFSIVNDNISEPTEIIKISLSPNPVFYNLANASRFIYINSLTGIDKNLQGSSIKVFPNPAKGFLGIEDDGFTENRPYVIINSMGQLMHCGELKLNEKWIDISSLSKGVYFLKIDHTKLQFVVN